MAQPTKVPREEYEKFRDNMREKHGYDTMSDEEKRELDSKIDQVAVPDDEAEDVDDKDGEVAEKGEFDDGHPKERDDDDDYVL